MAKWNEVKTDFLRDLYERGWSARSAAVLMSKEFKEPYTRNSIIGKCARLGLVRKQTKKEDKTFQTRTMVPHLSRKSTPRPPRPFTKKTLKNLPALVLTKRLPEGRECKWPYGEPQSPDYRVCGRPRLDQRPYCEYHTFLATGVSYAKPRKPTSFNIKGGTQR